MLTTVEGIYKEGQIELLEAPQDVHEARILVTFLDSDLAAPQQHRQIQFGQFAGSRETTEDDFQLAEWHGDAEELDGD